MTSTKRRNGSRLLLVGGALALLVLLLAPSAIAGTLGGLIASLWVTVMGAVTAIIAGLFGVSGH